MEGLGYVGILLLVVAVFIGIVAAVLNRRTKTVRDQMRLGDKIAPELDVERPRAKVLDFHVRGDQAVVTFAVPLPPGDIDGVLSELLLDEAVEVLHEKQATLPIKDVTKVVAFAGDGERRKVGELELAEPGLLPPISPVARFRLSSVGYDPLDRQFEEGPPASPPEVAASHGRDTLPPVGDDLSLPKAIDVGLRAQGIDPATMTAAEMVRGVLKLFDYAIVPGEDPGTYLATKAGSTTFVREDVYESGDYPEVDEDTIRSFMIGFLNSKADRGLLVSGKFAPFAIYEQEHREPRIRFITRERLQKFVDAFLV